MVDFENPKACVAYVRDHIELLRKLAPEAKTRVHACAAKLINLFHPWQNWKVPLYNNNEWICQPLRIIREELGEEHSLHVIREAIALLERLGLMERRQNLREGNGRNGQNRTYQYRIKVEVVDKLLRAEPKKLKPTIPPQPE